jgi:hypothetical protein
MAPNGKPAEKGFKEDEEDEGREGVALNCATANKNRVGEYLFGAV